MTQTIKTIDADNTTRGSEKMRKGKNEANKADGDQENGSIHKSREIRLDLLYS